MNDFVSEKTLALIMKALNDLNNQIASIEARIDVIGKRIDVASERIDVANQSIDLLRRK